MCFTTLSAQNLQTLKLVPHAREFLPAIKADIFRNTFGFVVTLFGRQIKQMVQILALNVGVCAWRGVERETKFFGQNIGYKTFYDLFEVFGARNWCTEFVKTAELI